MQTKVKICGITNLEDALCAAEAGADYLGYIFFAPSKRFVAPRTAAEITRRVRADFPWVQHVGVFVDEEASNISWIMNLAGMDYAQLHGSETPAFVEELAMLNVDVIKTIGIGLAGARQNSGSYDVSFFLCDTHDEQLKGGTGRQFNLEAIPADIPMARLFIAGGLNADNIEGLLYTIRPFAVDVSSGVEVSPGKKSHPQIKNFIKSVRACCESQTPGGPSES